MDLPSRTRAALGLVALALAAVVMAHPAPAAAGPCTVIGTAGADLLTGTSGPDEICGLGGDDVLWGFGGDDVLRGGDGNDILYPGAGANVAHGHAGTDTVRYVGLPARVIVDLQAGTVSGAATGILTTIENLVGTDHSDQLRGSSAANRIDGRAGNDTIVGRAGTDHLFGAEGADAVWPGGVHDRADGGPGTDTLSYGDLDQGVHATIPGVAPGTQGFENLIGTQYDDTLEGSPAAEKIFGRGGDDVIRPYGGHDQVQGGTGTDTLGYENLGIILSLSDGIRVDLSLGTVTIDGGDAGSVSGIEDVRGTELDDHLIGDGGANRLEGADGDDVLEGNGGDDHLSGFFGDDSLEPGEGENEVLGGFGADSVDYAHESSTIVVEPDGDGGWTVATDAQAETDLVSRVETVFATPAADHLSGGLGAIEVTFVGRGGADDISTVDGSGADAIIQGPGTGAVCVGDPGDTDDC